MECLREVLYDKRLPVIVALTKFHVVTTIGVFCSLLSSTARVSRRKMLILDIIIIIYKDLTSILFLLAASLKIQNNNLINIRYKLQNDYKNTASVNNFI